MLGNRLNKELEVFFNFSCVHYAFERIRTHAIKFPMLLPFVQGRITKRLVEALRKIRGGFSLVLGKL